MGEPPLLMTRVPMRCSWVMAGCMASIITRGWRTFMVRPKMWNIGMTERKLYWSSPEEGSKGSLAQPEATLLVRQMVLVRLD